MERCCGQAAMVHADHVNLWWGVELLIPLLKQLYLAWKRRKEAKNDQNKCSSKPKMASFYEKPSLFKLQKTWNEKTILPKVYKLTILILATKTKPKSIRIADFMELNSVATKMTPQFWMRNDKYDKRCVY